MFIPSITQGQNSINELQAPPDYSKSKTSPVRNKVLRPRQRQERLKQTLEQLHNACKNFWQDQGGNKECSPVVAAQGKYGFKIPKGVTVKASGDETSFSGAAFDSKIKIVYGIDSRGEVTRQTVRTRSSSKSTLKRQSTPPSHERRVSQPKRDVKAMMGGSEICEEDVGMVKRVYKELYQKEPFQCGQEKITEVDTNWECKKRSSPQGPCKKNIVGCSLPVKCTVDAMGEYKRFEKALAEARKNDPKFWEFFKVQNKFVTLLRNVYTACRAHWKKNGNGADCQKKAFPEQYFKSLPKNVVLEFSGDLETYYATATDRKTGYQMVMEASGKIRMAKSQ